MLPLSPLRALLSLFGWFPAIPMTARWLLLLVGGAALGFLVKRPEMPQKSSSIRTFLCASQVAGEQKYHPECFTCLNCRTFIGDGDTYALVERSKLYW